jgi:hypothetical protein
LADKKSFIKSAPGDVALQASRLHLHHVATVVGAVAGPGQRRELGVPAVPSPSVKAEKLFFLRPLMVLRLNKLECFIRELIKLKRGRNDTQHNDIQHNDTQHNNK